MTIKQTTTIDVVDVWYDVVVDVLALTTEQVINAIDHSVIPRFDDTVSTLGIVHRLLSKSS